MRNSKGQFKKGHKLTVGNKGNTRSKFGNKNACKYGYIEQSKAFMDETETFYYLQYDLNLIKLSKRYGIMDEKGRLYLRSDVIKDHLEITDKNINYVFKHEIQKRLKDAEKIVFNKLIE